MTKTNYTLLNIINEEINRNKNIKFVLNKIDNKMGNEEDKLIFKYYKTGKLNSDELFFTYTYKYLGLIIHNIKFEFNDEIINNTLSNFLLNFKRRILEEGSILKSGVNNVGKIDTIENRFNNNINLNIKNMIITLIKKSFKEAQSEELGLSVHEFNEKFKNNKDIGTKYFSSYKSNATEDDINVLDFLEDDLNFKDKFIETEETEFFIEKLIKNDQKMKKMIENMKKTGKMNQFKKIVKRGKELRKKYNF